MRQDMDMNRSGRTSSNRNPRRRMNSKQKARRRRIRRWRRFLASRNGRILIMALCAVIVVGAGIGIGVGIAGHKGKNDTQQVSGSQSESTGQNKKPPVISGVQNKSFQVGDKITYLTGVSAVDAQGREVDVEVDKSAVHTDEPGSYSVTYTATDADGNRATATATIEITAPAPTAAVGTNQPAGTLNDVVKQVLAEITNSSMSTGQKLYAVYEYAHGRIGYAGTPLDGVDAQNEAYQALTLIQQDGYVGGDCFTYCSVDKALLEGLGYQCVWVNNQGALTGDHSWVLVNAGTGYYHFDATQLLGGYECFMKTDAELQEYMDTQGKTMYRRDTSAYPATATAAFVY